MNIYAQLNNDNMVVGISQLSGEVIADNMVDINDLDIELGSTYDRKTKKFTPPMIQAGEPQPTLEDVAEETLLETKYQTLLLELML